VDDVTLPDSGTAAQLGRLTELVTEVRIDIGVIKVRSEQWARLEARVTALEAFKARMAAVWAASTAIGALVGGFGGWLAAFLTVKR